MKNCPKCKKDKPEREFFRIRRGKIIHQDACCSCRRMASKAKRLNRHGLGYAGRNLILESMGFNTYREYLDSELWARIRRKVYSIKGRDCFLCGSAATALHHNRYHISDLKGKTIKHIHPICRKCHERIEFKKGEKVSLKKAKKAFESKRSFRRQTIHLVNLFV